MNLHEECLIKYLINPFDLFQATEVLKLNNCILEKRISERNFLAKKTKINYTGV